MRRMISLSLIFSLAVIIFAGCGKSATTERKEVVTTPDGSTTTTDTHKVESKGKMPPTNSRGEKAN